MNVDTDGHDGGLACKPEDMVVDFFFFQAEDGIRDGTVTGVQTCALPIWAAARIEAFGIDSTKAMNVIGDTAAGTNKSIDQVTNAYLDAGRSEERHVGKECRSRGSPYHEKKKVELSVIEQAHECRYRRT